MSKQVKRPAKPKQLRAIQTSRHLHMTHSRHTGQLLPRRTTSYPTLVMIVLCVGVFLFSWTHLVTADQSYVVHASVPGPPPSVPATIDSPADGSQLTSAPITVSGTCPLNTYVGLTRNSFSSGVALCDASGRYQIGTDLFAGTDQLVAYDYSFTDIQGPASNMVTVYYTPPAPPVSGGGNTAGGNHSGLSRGTLYNPSSPASAGLPEPLLLKSSFSFIGYYIGQLAVWRVTIEGGVAPYAINAEWGDGRQQLYSQPAAGTLDLQHIYTKTGGYRGSYVVKLTATDAKGDQTYLQLLAIVSPRPKTSLAGATGQSGGNLFGGFDLTPRLTYMWSGYGVVLLMLCSFWLGERRELHYLRLHPGRRRHV